MSVYAVARAARTAEAVAVGEAADIRAILHCGPHPSFVANQ